MYVCFKSLFSGISMIDVLLLLVSSFAIIQYLLQRKQARKSAATNVYVQIKEFDNYILSIRNQMNENKSLTDFDLFSLNVAFSDNQWDKNKYLLINKLNEDDIALINRTYETIESIERLREEIIQMFVAINNPKVYALQFNVIEKIDNLYDKDRMESLCDSYNKCGYVLNSKISYEAFYSKLEQYENVAGTTTLNKLKELSYQNS